MTGNKDKS